jgi:FkbM family methyltransferase
MQYNNFNKIDINDITIDNLFNIDNFDMENIYKLWLLNKINKHDFIKNIWKFHKILFNYSKYLNNNIIKDIYISSNNIEICTIYGVKFYCNQKDIYGIPLGAFIFKEVERIASKWLFIFMKKNDIFYDIGANIGWYSLHIAKKNTNSNIYSFEPINTTYNQLCNNIKLNKLNNITTFNCALGDKNDRIKFYFRKDMTGAASAQNITEDPLAEELLCYVRRLDDCWSEIGQNPSLIKCDVEGAELFVFQGGRKCLIECKPIVFCEMLRKWSAKFGYSPNELINFFSELGYNCYEPSEDKLFRFTQMTEETLTTNFFFLHKENHFDIISNFCINK